MWARECQAGLLVSINYPWYRPLEYKMLMIPTEPVYLLVFLMRDIVSVGISKIENYKWFDCWNATHLKSHFSPIEFSTILTKLNWTWAYVIPHEDNICCMLGCKHLEHKLKIQGLLSVFRIEIPCWEFSWMWITHWYICSDQYSSTWKSTYWGFSIPLGGGWTQDP